MSAIKIAHTVANIDDEASGPSYSVPSLVAALNELGNDTEVVTVSKKGLTTALGAPVRSFAADAIWPGILRKLGSSRPMRRYIARSNAEIFHAHGLWMMSTIYPANRARLSGSPLVLAPRGMLGGEALKFSRFAKRAFSLAVQDRALRVVSCYHATAQSELEDIRAFGLKQPIAVIPNGIELPDLPVDKGLAEESAPYILSLGRVHPKKALDRLIAAFSRVSGQFPEWNLRIVGPSEVGYSAALREQASRLGLVDRVLIEEPVFGDAKVALMRNAALFALPTLHENFAMTVAESLAVETPVISTRGAPWSGLETNGCGWWIDQGEEPMAAALQTAMALSCEERSVMGARGREWMHRDFGWAGIAERMEQVYRWLLKSGQRPDFVWID